ncbi:Putative peptidyl-arginine deiminase, Porphyromonas-type [Septoria linicola]|uniref:Peptidyl-arginine deiminase, Porphyromonas-type n=1 Tax=Septoria linicola TaxID=215465 RepID=A0A9Q9AMU3_9PEZI|nr:Putative peptidyl-arginine deiminase, Porphyromonas-type [Septoria linicola]
MTPRRFHLPAETDRHDGTIMAWPTLFSVTGEAHDYPGGDLSQTRLEVANVARAIAQHERLHLFVRDTTTGEGHGIQDTNFKSAQEALGDVANVTIHQTPNIHSLWARDTAPVYVRSMAGPIGIKWGRGDTAGVGSSKKDTSSTIVGMVLNYNQWGRKNAPTADMYLAATAAETLNKSYVLAPFVAEGGGLMWDGEGTMLATESAILNPNRNPGIDKQTMESYFAHCFGIQKTIWVPGRRGFDITDDHIDALARFVSPGKILLSKPFSSEAWESKTYNDLQDTLSTVTDAKGRSFTTIDVPEPDLEAILREDYCPDSGPVASYVNFHIVNGAVIVPAFGDTERDAEAARIIGEQFPDRKVQQVLLRQLPMQGGGIHCATQQIPSE